MTSTRGCSCGCCAGIEDRTPQPLFNRPGLVEIAYRAGTYARFRDSMTAGLTRSDRPALAALRTRDPADFSIALIDAWAVAADVLTFYTERAANENYLGTATERRSVAGIVGLIGYRLGPGVAAQAELAFSVDVSPGSPTLVPIVTGARVQTLPGPAQLPQTYETVEDLAALADWNRLLPRQTQPRVPRNGDQVLLLAGTASGVNRGDVLLFVGDGADETDGYTIARATAVAADRDNDRTTVWFAVDSGSLDDPATVRAYAMRQRAAFFGFNSASPLLFVPDVQTALGEQLTDDNSEWAFANQTPSAVDLDAVYDGSSVGSPVLLRNGDDTRRATILTIGETARTAYGISAKVTRLGLDLASDDPALDGGATRTTVVLLRAEELALAEAPVSAPVFGTAIELDAPVTVPETLPRPILVRGHRVRVRTVPEAEVVMMLDDGTPVLTSSADLVVLSLDVDQADPGLWHLRVQGDDGRLGTLSTAVDNVVTLPAHADDPLVGETVMVDAVDGTTLLLSRPLTHAYDRNVEIWGNVAAATHGESGADEVLGSGEAARTFQHFRLRRSPLTHTQAATPSGGASTLRVFVNDVEWTEVPSLYGHGPRDRVFVTTTTDEGGTIVRFGDGVSGARLPTGRDNVRARYRVGTGLAGLAAPDQLSLLMTRPLGLKAVRNPLAASGAQDPQVGADAADDAPRTVLTLDRIVSLSDYADFAANMGGVGKAGVTWTWDGVVRGISLSVAGVAGAPIDPASDLMVNLTAALRAAGNRRVPLVVLPAEVGLFTLEASLVLDAGYVPEPVLSAARAALEDHFSFARRDFGQIVSLGEVDRVLHAVRGVTGVIVSRLHRSGTSAFIHPYLVARSLVPGAAPSDVGAEVLTIDTEQLRLEVTP